MKKKHKLLLKELLNLASMWIILFLLYLLFLFFANLYQVMTGKDYHSMQRKLDEMELVIRKQEEEIWQLRNELDKRNYY